MFAKVPIYGFKVHKGLALLRPMEFTSSYHTVKSIYQGIKGYNFLNMYIFLSLKIDFVSTIVQTLKQAMLHFRWVFTVFKSIHLVSNGLNSQFDDYTYMVYISTDWRMGHISGTGLQD